MFRTLVLVMLLGAAPVAAQPASERLSVRLDTAQAEAALTILERQRDQRPVREADWQRLFAAAGYRRLKEREASMNRTFEDAEFRTFLTSAEQIGRAGELRRALNEWRALPVDRAATAAFTYLPDNATIRATIYITIKPRTNSFVFDVENDPAIFLYLDPAVGAAKIENTVTHELHHIGFGTACPPADIEARHAALSPPQARLRMWMGAYGEGFAMLAAAGGPETHPHAVSGAAERDEWNTNVGRMGEHMADQSAFFSRVAYGELTDLAAIDAQARTYYGVQGPWYTVGWMMAVTIERVLGRERLIEAMCRQDDLLATYNEAAFERNDRSGEEVPMWDTALVERLSGD